MEKRRVSREECKRLREDLEAGGFHGAKRMWIIAKHGMLEDRGVLPKEEGHLIRKSNAMHEMEKTNKEAE